MENIEDNDFFGEAVLEQKASELTQGGYSGPIQEGKSSLRLRQH
jgi:hypothetical protein